MLEDIEFKRDEDSETNKTTELKNDILSNILGVEMNDENRYYSGCPFCEFSAHLDRNGKTKCEVCPIGQLDKHCIMTPYTWWERQLNKGCPSLHSQAYAQTFYDYLLGLKGRIT